MGRFCAVYLPHLSAASRSLLDPDSTPVPLALPVSGAPHDGCDPSRVCGGPLPGGLVERHREDVCGRAGAGLPLHPLDDLLLPRISPLEACVDLGELVFFVAREVPDLSRSVAMHRLSPELVSDGRDWLEVDLVSDWDDPVPPSAGGIGQEVVVVRRAYDHRVSGQPDHPAPVGHADGVYPARDEFL